MKTNPTIFSGLEGQAEWLELKFPFQRQMCPLRETGYSHLTSTLASAPSEVEGSLLLWEASKNEIQVCISARYLRNGHFNLCGSH